MIFSGLPPATIVYVPPTCKMYSGILPKSSHSISLKIQHVVISIRLGGGRGPPSAETDRTAAVIRPPHSKGSNGSACSHWSLVVLGSSQDVLCAPALKAGRFLDEDPVLPSGVGSLIHGFQQLLVSCPLRIPSFSIEMVSILQLS